MPRWAWFYLLLLGVSYADECPERTTPTPASNGDYDFIIAGAGTAGAIVAARLASAGFCVLVIESGYRLYDDPILSSQLFEPIYTIVETFPEIMGQAIPIFQNLQNMPFVLPYVGMTNAAHQYLTVPQLYSQKREVNYPRGNMIGGSSGANAMVYFRGSVRDFTIWKEDYGLEGWGFEDVLPYFKKFENNEDVKNASDIHGYSGPINITIVKNHFVESGPPVEAWSAAAQKMGYPKIEDSSDPRTVYGASDTWQTFVGSSGRRSDSSVYIDILDKKGKVSWNSPTSQCKIGKNLNVWNGTRVTKVLIDPNTKRAYGVEYTQAAGLDRSEHPFYPPSTDEATKNNAPYNKWDRTSQTSCVGGLVDTEAERLGAPVAKSLAYDFSRPHDQYIPGTPTPFSSKTVTAKYEVILAAGAIATPQLLMLSGIGPKQHLAERGIPLIEDLPVGTHTNDHQEVFIQWKFPITYEPPFNLLVDILAGTFGELHKYQNRQRSFYSSSEFVGGLDGSSDGPNCKNCTPKWHMHHLMGGAFENVDWNIASYSDTINPPYRVPRGLLEIPGWAGLSMHVHGCELSENHAFGRIELRNKDPLAPPFVDPRWGSSDEDMAELVDCVKTMRYLMGNTTNRNFVGQESEPSASAKTDVEIEQFIRNSMWGHHISSSAPMGNCTSPYAVTDAKGRVYGVDSLRVVDISVFPTIPHGNPAGVVMMVAEKLAEQIVKDYNVQIPSTL
eukprot:Phypoly_transcript_03866.p1 GENE.Phypoly_transcript_03866~~Phypoly_transcript_03866.p1  ORF type:complete len:727 (+),score=102.27 Phypoly_transcript_03866:97-2277(+)